MSLRTIMIFPQFHNIEIIDKIRGQYDHLADLVRPHITIVFPFESELSNEELSGILSERLKNIRPFSLKLQGVSQVEDTYGNYLFLEVKEGLDEIVRMHDSFYQHEFSRFDLGLPYVPHMTVGKLTDKEALKAAYDAVKSCGDIFETIVDKISVEMIGENEESIIVIEKEL